MNTPPDSPPEVALRGVSDWSVEMLGKMGCDLFFTGKDGLTNEQVHEQTMALLWLHHPTTDEDEAEAAIEAGEWQPLVKRFRRHPDSLGALPQVPALVERARVISEATLSALGADEAEDTAD